VLGAWDVSAPRTYGLRRVAYHGCPDGPVGRHKERCSHCDGSGVYEGAICYVCNGQREVTMAGLPEYDGDLARERKADGWRIA
jgi:hypothetical protein